MNCFLKKVKGGLDLRFHGKILFGKDKAWPVEYPIRFGFRKPDGVFYVTLGLTPGPRMGGRVFTTNAAGQQTFGDTGLPFLYRRTSGPPGWEANVPDMCRVRLADRGGTNGHTIRCFVRDDQAEKLDCWGGGQMVYTIQAGHEIIKLEAGWTICKNGIYLPGW